MAKTFFTSDEHIGHENIIRYVNRPFKTTDEVVKALINNHNSKVSPEDHTWHLGDMFWRTYGVGPALAYLAALNGTHSVIIGNHDELIEENEILRFAFKEVVGSKNRPGMAVLPVPNIKKQKLVLCHYAGRFWLDSHKGAWHLYGHSHGEAAEHGKSFDIGVDGPANFFPLSFEEIAREMQRRESVHGIPANKVWPGKEFPTDHLPEGSH
jgi:calcineurin-like phosphoesterase family protein